MKNKRAILRQAKRLSRLSNSEERLKIGERIIQVLEKAIAKK